MQFIIDSNKKLSFYYIKLYVSSNAKASFINILKYVNEMNLLK
jgi:hypothetical protein